MQNNMVKLQTIPLSFIFNRVT